MKSVFNGKLDLPLMPSYSNSLNGRRRGQCLPVSSSNEDEKAIPAVDTLPRGWGHLIQKNAGRTPDGAVEPTVNLVWPRPTEAGAEIVANLSGCKCYCWIEKGGKRVSRRRT